MKLTRLTEIEKQCAEENHKLVYSFLHKNHYSIEEYYSIVVFGYLKAIQDYYRIEEKRKKYALSMLAYLYMRTEMSNHFKVENSQCRKLKEEVISLDAEYEEKESFYNILPVQSAEDDVMEQEMVTYVMKKLSKKQKKIVKFKIDGLSNKEVYQMLKIKPSTYYKQMQVIKENVEKAIA